MSNDTKPTNLVLVVGPDSIGTQVGCGFFFNGEDFYLGQNQAISTMIPKLQSTRIKLEQVMSQMSVLDKIYVDPVHHSLFHTIDQHPKELLLSPPGTHFIVPRALLPKVQDWINDTENPVIVVTDWDTITGTCTGAAYLTDKRGADE